MNKLETHNQENTLPELHIGNITTELPIIQGGMGIGISIHTVAGNVALQWGIGTLSSAGLYKITSLRSGK